MPGQDEPSIFTRIINREIPAEILFESDTVIAIRDIAPQAPVHLLVIPKTPDYRDVVDLASADPGLLAEMVATAKQLAQKHCGGEFRLVFNTGSAAGQTVFHVHAHLLGGRLTEETIGD